MVTRMACAVAPETPQADATLTVTLAAEIVPEGKPEPVTLTAEVPLVPELGEADAANVTDCALPAIAQVRKHTAPIARAIVLLLPKPERMEGAAKVGMNLRRRRRKRPSRPVPARMKALGSGVGWISA